MNVPSINEALLQEQNRKLREEVEDLQETVRQLRASMAGDDLPDWLPHLTPGERRVIAALRPGRLVGYEQLVELVWPGREEPDTARDILKVWVCRLRQKLFPLGIRINTLWGQGYQITPASRDLLAAPSREAA